MRNTILATLLVFGLGGLATSVLASKANLASGLGTVMAHTSSGVHNWGGRQSGNRFRCEKLSADHTKFVSAFISASLDLSDAQEDQLQPMIQVIDDWRADMKITCENHSMASVQDGLTTAQVFMERTASALSALTVEYSTFESSLDAEQKAVIQEHIAKHQSRHPH